ncbi:hypothetical protein PRBEI_2000899900 [Prionailurus iriomotensis]
MLSGLPQNRQHQIPVLTFRWFKLVFIYHFIVGEYHIAQKRIKAFTSCGKNLLKHNSVNQ